MRILYQTKKGIEILLAFGFQVVGLVTIEVDMMNGKKKRFNIKNLVGASRR